MGFPRQEYWSGLPFPSPVYFPKPAVEPRSSALQAVSSIAGGFFTNWATRRASDQSNVLLHLELTTDWLTSSKSYVLLLLLSRFSHVLLCNPIDGSPWGFPIPGILQARTVDWVAISFPVHESEKVKVKSLSRVWLLATPWTAADQAPLSMGFSRQEYWSGVPLLYPKQLCNNS